MGLRTKFNLVLAAVCLIGFFAAQAYAHKVLMMQAREEVSRIAKTSLAMAIAVRKHSSQQIKPFFDAHQGSEFSPGGVPAFAVKDTMRLFNENFPGHTYREVALNPTNPADLALGWEKDLVDRYRSGALDGQFEMLMERNGRSELQLARPFKITDISCLACHGKPEHAPPAMVAKYGSSAGFGWKMGEIIGAQILTVPAQEPIAKANGLYRGFLALLGGAFGLLFVALNLTLYQLVLVPINKANAHLKRIACEDVLTGASTRRNFLDLMQVAVAQAQQESVPLSVVTFDIDHFKKVNDNFGHGAGDVVLRGVCDWVAQATKRRDHLGRLGGEEFALLMPATAIAGARALAQSLCEGVAKLEFEQVGHVTASFGVAQCLPGDSVVSLLQRADESLYRAKGGGRNRVDPGSLLSPFGQSREPVSG